MEARVALHVHVVESLEEEGEEKRSLVTDLKRRRRGEKLKHRS